MNNSLFHHGILGQKWGIRRFRNEDGTLTPAGRSRYGTKGQKQLAKKISKYAKKGKEKQATKLISKVINETGQAQIKDDIKNYSKLSDKWNDLDEKLDEAWKDASIRLRNKVDAQMKKDGVDPNDKHRGYWEEEFIMKDPKYQKINNEWEKAYQNMKAAEKDICDTLLGEYGKKPIKDKERYRKDVSAYVSGLLLRMKNTYNSAKLEAKTMANDNKKTSDSLAKNVTKSKSPKGKNEWNLSAKREISSVSDLPVKRNGTVYYSVGGDTWKSTYNAKDKSTADMIRKVKKYGGKIYVD